MEAKIIMLIIGLIAGIGVGFHTFIDNNGYEQAGISYEGGECDRLLHGNIPLAIGYRNGQIIETVKGGNLYEATATDSWDYDYIEIYRNINRKGGKKIYRGKLYIDIRARCR